MTVTYRPAKREGDGVIVGVAGSSGSGKTFSAMRLAAGIVGKGKRFAVIDTEAGRALHYADLFAFDHGDLRPPFRPDAYADAILAAAKAGYAAIVVDSASHEWNGDGGVLDWHEEELQRMAGTDWQRREACKMAAWIKPKVEHKGFVQKMLQVRAHLILCFRAEEKVEMIRGDDGKMKIVPKKSPAGIDGWMPICEKNMPYELTASFLLLATAPGVPKPIKLQEQHRPIFPAGQVIDESCGARLAAWAHGGKKNATKEPEHPPQEPAHESGEPAPGEAGPPDGGSEAPPEFAILGARGKHETFPDATTWAAEMTRRIGILSPSNAEAVRKRHGPMLAALHMAGYTDAVREVEAAFAARNMKESM